jgi:hypothetical protein
VVEHQLPKLRVEGSIPFSRSNKKANPIMDWPLFFYVGVEPLTGFEPATCCLRNSCSTAELKRQIYTKITMLLKKMNG